MKSHEQKFIKRTNQEEIMNLKAHKKSLKYDSMLCKYHYKRITTKEGKIEAKRKIDIMIA